MSNGSKLFRYRVTSVWGTMHDRLEVGQVVIDEERHDDDGEAWWEVWNLFADVPAGGFAGQVIGPYEGLPLPATPTLATPLSLHSSSPSGG